MSSIDTRIVEMKFDNKQFLRGIGETLKALDGLDSTLNGGKGGSSFGNLAAGLDQAQNEANRFSLQGIINAIDSVRDKFSVLGAVGFSAIQSITHDLINLGKDTLGKIATGGIDRALSIEEAQFKLRGLDQDVEQTMESALAAVKGTSYGLDEAVTVAASFGATGMQAGDDMTQALLGVSGMAAMTGSSFGEIGHIFTQIAGEGKLSTMRMEQFSTRGINAAAALAKELGVTEAEVRQMVSNGEVSFDMFTEAMSNAFGEHATKANETYRGSLSNVGSALSRIGASIHTPRLEGLRRTFNALTPVIDDVHDSLNPLIDLYADFVTGLADTRIEFLEGLDLGEGSHFAQGIENIAETLRSFWDIVSSLAGPIGEAWKSVFPGSILESFAQWTASLRELVENFKMGSSTGERIGRVFKGVFAVFSIGIEVFKQIASSIFGFFQILFGGVGEGTGGLLEMAAAVGDLIFKFQQWAVEGQGIQRFFEQINSAIGSVLRPLMVTISLIGEAFARLFAGDFSGFKSKMSDAFSSLSEPLSAVNDLLGGFFDRLGTWADTARENLRGIGEGAFAPLIWAIDWILAGVSRLADALDLSFDFGLGGIGDEGNSGLQILWNGLAAFFGGLGDLFSPMLSSIGGFLGGITDIVSGWIENLTLQEALATVNTGVLVAMGILVKNFIDKLSEIVDSFTGIGESITTAFGQLTDTLKTMQQGVKAQIILTIAIAVGILAASLWLLSRIDGDRLATALVGLAAVFGTMIGALAVLQNFNLTKNVGIITTAAGLVLLAVAVSLLVSAVKRLSDLDWGELIKGLLGVAGLLAGLALFTQMAKVSKGGLRQSAGLILLAVAIGILSFAVEKIGKMDTGTLIKGIVALGVMLAGLAVMITIMSGTKGVFRASAGILVLSVAILALYFAMTQFIKIDWLDFAKGMAMIALAVSAVGLALHLMPKTSILQAAALIVISAALVVLADVLKTFGNMGWDQILKAGVVLAGTLGLIAVAMTLMQGTLLGSAALIIAAGALGILALVLITLGNMEWTEILTALAALAGVFVVLGLAALVLGPILPILAGLALVIAALGLAALVAGVGVLAFATGFGILAAVGAAGVAVLVTALTGVINLIPIFMENIALGLVAFAIVIEENAPIIIGALGTLLSAFLVEVEGLIPDVLSLIETLMLGIIDLIVRLTPDVAQAGFDMLIAFLEKIRDNIGEVVDVVFEIIDAFIEALIRNKPRLERQARLLMGEFGGWIREKLESMWNSFIQWGKDVGTRLVDGVVDGLADVGGRVAGAARSLGHKANAAMRLAALIFSPSRVWRDFGHAMGEGLALGIEDETKDVEKSSTNIGESAHDALKKSLSSIASVLDGDIDMNPVITPVLDLSDVRKSSSEISGLLSPSNLSIDFDRSSLRAGSVQRMWDRNQKVAAENARRNTPIETTKTEINYTQTNTSPKALSAAEIYRHTKNQLSMIKEVSDARKG